VEPHDTVNDLVIQLTGASPSFYPEAYTFHRPCFRLGSLSGDETMASLGIGHRSIFHARL